MSLSSADIKLLSSADIARLHAPMWSFFITNGYNDKDSTNEKWVNGMPSACLRLGCVLHHMEK